MTPKAKVSALLDDTNTESGRWVTLTVALLILLSAAIFVVETYPIGEQWQLILSGLDWVILGLFTVEYGLRVWSSDRSWHYVFSLYGLVDLVAILPFLLGFFDTRFVRLLRWLRILRLLRLFSDRAILGRLTAADTLALARIVFTLVAIIFIYAGIIFQVEQHYHPETFNTFLDAVYFAVVTMTTVGYGDITPVSEAGRGFTVMMILSGIALIPTQLGDLIRRVVKVSQALQIACVQCGWAVHDADARFCKRCGAVLPLDTLPAIAGDRPPTAWETSLMMAPRSASDIAPFPPDPSAQRDRTDEPPSRSAT